MVGVVTKKHEPNIRVRHPEKVGKPDNIIKKKTQLDKGKSTKFKRVLGDPRACP